MLPLIFRLCIRPRYHSAGIMVPLAPTGLSRDANWHDSHNILVTNAIAQAEALACGAANAAEPSSFEGAARPR